MFSEGGHPAFLVPRACRVGFPSEPPVAGGYSPQRRTAGKGAQRRSEPLPASTVVAFGNLDGRTEGNPHIPFGEL